MYYIRISGIVYYLAKFSNNLAYMINRITNNCCFHHFKEEILQRDKIKYCLIASDVE